MTDGRPAICNENFESRLAAKSEGHHLVCSGPSCSVLDMINARKQSFGEYCDDPLNSYAATLTRSLSDDGFYFTTSLVRKTLREKGLQGRRGHERTL